MNKREIINNLKLIPTGNVQTNQEIIAEALIYILENKEKVLFT